MRIAPFGLPAPCDHPPLPQPPSSNQYPPSCPTFTELFHSPPSSNHPDRPVPLLSQSTKHLFSQAQPVKTNVRYFQKKGVPAVHFSKEDVLRGEQRISDFSVVLKFSLVTPKILDLRHAIQRDWDILGKFSIGLLHSWSFRLSFERKDMVNRVCLLGPTSILCVFDTNASDGQETLLLMKKRKWRLYGSTSSVLLWSC